MIDVETAAAPEGRSLQSRLLALLVALTAAAAACAALLAVRIDQRADRANAVVVRNSVQSFRRAEFRTIPRDTVELAGIRAEELRGIGQSRVMSSDDRERRRGAAQR